MQWLNVYNIVLKVRKDHPGMGIRTIWEQIQPLGIGRNDFEYLAMQHGLGVSPKKNYYKTTDSYGAIWQENLIKGIKLTRLNQVWVSDITYYRMNNIFYYITLIMDLWSRKIVGYAASKNLASENTTIPAMRYAIKTRLGKEDKNELIFHSDAGGQYRDMEFVSLLNKNNILRSMAKDAYENAHAERLNGTIKNQYVYLYDPRKYEEFKRDVAKSCLMYNTERPHQSKGKISPTEFEKRQRNKKLLTSQQK